MRSRAWIWTMASALQLSCSWKLPAGCDAIIAASFYGTKGGASFHNVDGSFYNFVAEQFHGTNARCLPRPGGMGRQGRARLDASGLRRTRNSIQKSKLDPRCRTLDAIYAAIRYSHERSSCPITRRILMTADTIGGVWTYALEFARALGPHGIEVTLATMGALFKP